MYDMYVVIIERERSRVLQFEFGRWRVPNRRLRSPRSQRRRGCRSRSRRLVYHNVHSMLCVYIYIYIMFVYIYIYIYREREI